MLTLIVLSVGFELSQRIGLRHFTTHDSLILTSQFHHFFFDFREVALADNCAVLWHHVVEESVLHCRSETELDAGIQFFQCFSQQVCAGVPEGMLAFFVLEFVECDGRIFVDGTIQFYRFAIDSARYNVACESRRYALGDLITSHSLFILANRAVWECDFNHNNLILTFNCVQRYAFRTKKPKINLLVLSPSAKKNVPCASHDLFLRYYNSTAEMSTRLLTMA